MIILEEAISKIKNIKIEHIFRSSDGNRFPYVKAIRETNSLLVICLLGPIDSNTVPVVFMDLKGKLNRYLNKHILLDFREVTHVDSATIANLIFLLSQLQQHQRKLAVTYVSPALESYIDIDKVSPLIHVYKNEEEAIRGLDGM